jgi:hypothetical protein
MGSLARALEMPHPVMEKNASAKSAAMVIQVCNFESTVPAVDARLRDVSR